MRGNAQAEGATPHSERFLQQAPFTQIANQRSSRLVCRCRPRMMPLDQLVVLVPELVAHLNVSHTCFDQSSRQQALSPEVVAARFRSDR
jgi:hypothetical protein